MTINVPRGKRDDVIDKIIEVLEDYEKDHPQARIDVYRQNSVSVRVRIIDPDFASQNKSERNGRVWKEYLAGLPEDVQSDISTMLLITPDETKDSIANLEFDDPTPSRL